MVLNETHEVMLCNVWKESRGFAVKVFQVVECTTSKTYINSCFEERVACFFIH